MKYKVVLEQDGRYYVASIPELPGCHTQARSKAELLKRLREAVELCLEESNSEATEFIEFEFVSNKT